MRLGLQEVLSKKNAWGHTEDDAFNWLWGRVSTGIGRLLMRMEAQHPQTLKDAWELVAGACRAPGRRVARWWRATRHRRVVSHASSLACGCQGAATKTAAPSDRATVHNTRGALRFQSRPTGHTGC